jgi:hypothetical protein
VARLREPTPPELAERVRFAVELAAQPSRRRRPQRWVLAGGGALVTAVITVIALMWPRPTQPADPPIIAAVAQIAQSMAASSTPSGTASTAPVPVGAPVAMVADGTHLTWRYYQLGGVEAAVVTSDRPFPMPAGAHTLANGGTDMAWTPRGGGWRCTARPVRCWSPHRWPRRDRGRNHSVGCGVSIH